MVTPWLFIIAALLALIVLLTVLRPLWQKKKSILLLLIGLWLACTVALYIFFGRSNTVEQTPISIDAPATISKTPTSLVEAAELWEAQAAANPQAAEVWWQLARVYTAQSRFDEAEKAYTNTMQLWPDDVDVMVDLVRTRIARDPKNQPDTASVALLESVLDLQPQHSMARWMLGMWHRQNGRAEQAAQIWEPLLSQNNVSTEMLETITLQVNAARQEAGLAPLKTEQSANVLLTVTIDLASELQAALPHTQTLYLFANPIDGTTMPVAAKQVMVKEFPLTLSLSDADSLMPTAKLSETQQVKLSARLSQSGEAMAQPGDLEATPIVVQVGEAIPQALLINQRLP